MLSRKPKEPSYNEITPESVYLNRRSFLRHTGLGLAAMLAGRSIGDLFFPTRLAAQPAFPVPAKSPLSIGESQTPFSDVTTYNNFYEFGTGKDEPAQNAQNLPTYPWTVSIEGEVKRPMRLTINDLFRLAPIEERIYRHRCVEGWSIVVPWAGYSFSHLAAHVQPASTARYVAFESFFDPTYMTQAKWAGIPFPYVEGLRIDEALHPLSLLCLGMYGAPLPKQDGAPVRMIIPWKYGFKSIKSLVRIRFVREQPPTTWSLANPAEYGFYANVNPGVDHPRWSQKKERRLGELFKRDTLIFNGYAKQVAHLYSGMDLRKNY